MRLHATTPAHATQVSAVGHYQPERVLTNADLTAMLETDDEWIRSRVGIRERRIAGEDETVATMATEAARAILAHAGREPEEVDLLIIATSTTDGALPNAAAQVAGDLGLTIPALDLNTACSGFPYALATAQHALLAGGATRALVIASEKYSQWTDWSDRTTAVLFGDAAGGALVERSDEQRIGPVVWGSDGSKSQLIRIPDRHSFFQQEGRSVFRWATSELAPIAVRACEEAGVKPSELAAFIPHQANLRIIEAIARKLGCENAIVARDVELSGNTSAASIPLALSKLVEGGELPADAPILLFGFGAGLTYAGQVILAPDTRATYPSPRHNPDPSQGDARNA
jgi:3-oxoacyl-[acyl-carrier-protein] synthase-3